MDCVFCRIISGEIQSDILYQDEKVIAIRDINPQAPTHILVLPRSHIASLTQVDASNKPLLGHLIHVASELARREKISGKGYRLVINSGAEAGQEVPHLHLHLLGGRALGKLG